MRRAFYCGAQGLLYALINSMDPSGETPADALPIMTDLLADLDDELNDFLEALKDGRA
jgi:hypothetical protein